MTPADFIAWRERLHLNRVEAAAMLGMSRNTVTAYEQGRTAIPLYVALACTAIAQGWPPMGFKPER